jgi:hypothetical protein
MIAFEHDTIFPWVIFQSAVLHSEIHENEMLFLLV